MPGNPAGGRPPPALDHRGAAPLSVADATPAEAGGPGPDLPTGTVTFLFSDIEGSTRLVTDLGPQRYGEILDLHRRVLRGAFANAGGLEVGTDGDSFFVVFPEVDRAVRAAADGQRALGAAAWPHGIGTLRVRIGLHTGDGVVAAGTYVGTDVNRAARISAAGHGGQILLSEASCALVTDRLPAGLALRDLGQHRLKDLRPERLSQLVVDGLPADFPPIRSLDARPNNLPTQLTSFVGREGELADAARLLDETRLLTLTGPGGTGKTRLALQLAASLADRYPDGVWWVPLATIHEPDLVPATIAMTFGLPDGGARPVSETLAEHLAGKRVLMVLDNFEQVVTASVVTDLLDEHEQRLFARFGIFMGGAALETAEAVCGPAAEIGMDVLDGLGSLVEKSLLQSVEDDHGDTRFVMLETIRAYASERLAGSGEEAMVRERHARALLSFARRAADELEGPARKVWLDRLADDHDNIRAALGWFIERGDAEGAGELVAGLWRFWHTRGHLQEGRARVERVLALPGWPADRPTARLRALEAAGGVAYWQGDLPGANRFYAEAAEIARGTGDKRELALALYNLFFAPPGVGSWDDWRTGIAANAGVMDEVLALYRELGDDRGTARALWGHGEYALFGGDVAVAERRFTESLEVSRRLGDAFGQSWSQYTLGMVHHLMGRLDDAARDYEAALGLFREAGDLSGIGFALIGFARLALSSGAGERAYRLAGAAESLTATTGAGLATMAVDAFGIEDIDPQPTDPALVEAQAEGRRLTTEHAIALAIGPGAQPEATAPVSA